MYLLDKLKIMHVDFFQRPLIQLFPCTQRDGDCSKHMTKPRISCLCCQRKNLKENTTTQDRHSSTVQGKASSSVISIAQHWAWAQPGAAVHSHCSPQYKELSETESFQDFESTEFLKHSDLGDLIHRKKNDTVEVV